MRSPLDPQPGRGREIRDPLAEVLARQRVLVLDGGLATTLEERGFDTSGALWSARAVNDAPELVEAVHSEFLDAGADCIVTATYQATVPALVKSGLREAEALAFFGRAVELAMRARAEKLGAIEAQGRLRPLVAASIGPYGAYLADGSEYRGDYRVGHRDLVDFHRPRLRELVAARPDLLAFETFPSGPEVAAVLELLDRELGRGDLPGAWIAFQCRDACSLADGTPLRDVVPALERHAAILAVGVNCVAPAIVPGVLETLGALTSKPLAVYPNSGERWEDGTWRGQAADWISSAADWVEGGARLVGGCCRTGPEDVRRLRASLLGGA